MEKKIYILLMILSVVVLRSTAIESFSLKGSSTLDRKEKANDDDDDEKSEVEEPELITSLSSRRNRYPGYGSSLGGSRSRSRWQPPQPSGPLFDEDSSDGNEWGKSGGFGLNSILSGLNGLFNQGPPTDDTPTCHSILDPQYTLFSDICGVVPQARYSLPNYFGHVERWQIAQALTTLLGPSNPATANPSCARSLKLLVCPLLFPPCKTGRRDLPAVLPCQPFCRAVKGQCPAPSLDLLPCDFLPPSSELCPVNPTPYSSLLSTFGAPYSTGGVASMGPHQSPLSSLLAQSALSTGLPAMGGLGQPAFPMNGFPSTGNFHAPGLGAGVGLPQYLQGGQSLPTQSPYYNYLPSLQTAQAGTHGGLVNGGLGLGLTGGQQSGALNGGYLHGMTGGYPNGMTGGQQGGPAHGGQQGGPAHGGQQGGPVQGGQQGGSVHGGPQGGSVHGGPQGGSVHGGQQGGPVHGGQQGGSIHGGPQGGPIHGGQQGGPIHGGQQGGPAVHGGFPYGLTGGQQGGLVNGGFSHGMTGGQQGGMNNGAPVVGPIPMRPINNGFNPAQYMAESLPPLVVDFPPLATIHDMRQAGRLFPSLRSSTEQA